MKKLRLAIPILVVILVLALPSLALADPPQRFEAQFEYHYPAWDCGSFVVWEQLIGGVTGYVHYDQNGQITRTFKHWQWDVREYNPDTGKEIWGICNILNFFEGSDTDTGMRATGVIYHATFPHFGIVYMGAGQLVFSTSVPDPTAILKQTGRSPFYPAVNKLCEALAP